MGQRLGVGAAAVIVPTADIAHRVILVAAIVPADAAVGDFRLVLLNR
ncbi:MAG: hypothetical protein KJ063_22960 [Anaerolineae bacterium]|nr:hypothetical protein [Anaerolineae bacterium]